jgi:hypothetical protein
LSCSTFISATKSFAKKTSLPYGSGVWLGQLPLSSFWSYVSWTGWELLVLENEKTDNLFGCACGLVDACWLPG